MTMMSFPFPEMKGMKTVLSDINQNKLKHTFRTVIFFLRVNKKNVSLKLQDKIEMEISKMDF